MKQTLALALVTGLIACKSDISKPSSYELLGNCFDTGQVKTNLLLVKGIKQLEFKFANECDTNGLYHRTFNYQLVLNAFFPDSNMYTIYKHQASTYTREYEKVPFEKISDKLDKFKWFLFVLTGAKGSKVTLKSNTLLVQMVAKNDQFTPFTGAYKMCCNYTEFLNRMLFDKENIKTFNWVIRSNNITHNIVIPIKKQ